MKTAPDAPLLSTPDDTEEAITTFHQAGTQLTDIEFSLFQKLLYDATGISLGIAKRSLVAGRLNKRLRFYEFNTYKAYFDWITRVPESPQSRREWQTAIDLLTTNETYFFREPRHFELLRDTILPQVSGQKIRVWSAAASTGEEAYTIAMVLSRHARGPWEVLGTDINSEVIVNARKGIYPLERSSRIPREYLIESCVRGIDEWYGMFRIHHSIRKKVRFTTANLLEANAQLGDFDIIFLRNVLIYFDPETKKRVIANLTRRLKKNGWLIVGHSESLNGIQKVYRTIAPSVYRLQGAK